MPYAKFIAVPYTAQKEKLDVESWDWFDPIGSTLNLTEIKKFYDNHTNQAPEGANSPCAASPRLGTPAFLQGEADPRPRMRSE